MGHLLDRCDILDLLEEAVVSGRPLSVELRNNRRFVDEVRDVITENGQEWAVFKTHEPVAVRSIHDCARTGPWGGTYAGKPS